MSDFNNDLSHQSTQKDIYSKIEPDLSKFSVEQLENALRELDNL